MSMLCRIALVAALLGNVQGMGVACLAVDYAIVDTGQERCYENRREIAYPAEGSPFFGQDAQYVGHEPSYRDNGDGTVSDLVTGLLWQKGPGPKKTYEEAVAGASACRVGGYDDWRLPSIKELYSLILFSGEDVDPMSTETSNLRPFIDRDIFGFVYGDPTKGERIIDSQMATSTKYVSTTMGGNETMFGVNFADGRIKGYPISSRRGGRTKTYYVFYVRGNPKYGNNDFEDNGDGTITDKATGLIWAKADSGHLKAGEKGDGKLNWEQALRWCEELDHAGHSDWRLPNIKELQSLVDYTRSPDTTDSAAIDPVFDVTPIQDARGKVNYPYYWSSTTHKRMGGGESAAYVAFGRSQGWMRSSGGKVELMDVHGAGSQRSDPKVGDPSQFPRGRGPQGDVIAIYNLVRPVRGGKARLRESGPELEPQPEIRRERVAVGRSPVGPEGGQRLGFVNRLDLDMDGKVSRTEFDGPLRAFDELDADRDGYLTESESPLGRRGIGPPPGRPPRTGSAPPHGRPLGPPSEMLPRPRRGFGRQSRGSRPGPRMRMAQSASARQPVDDRPAPAPPSGLVPIVPNRNSSGEALPNFVFILVDDMGWTGLSCSMDESIPDAKSDFYETPFIDRLAEQGMRFSNAYSPGAMCTPSRASILTGKSPALLRMTTPGPAGGQPDDRKLIPPRHVDSLPEAEITIAETLRLRGYGTAHFGKWHLSGGGPGRHGFEVHDGETGNTGPGLHNDPNPKDIFGITERAIAFMERHVAANKPFYVQLSHYAVHTPFRSLATTRAACAERPCGVRHSNVDFAAMTRDLDSGVGDLLESIERLGIEDKTYVVFMSDNGAAARPQSTENLPLAGGKATFWEGGIRVPLIIRGPGVERNSFCRQNVVGYDLFPTFSELAGAVRGADSRIEGLSLVPLLFSKESHLDFRGDRHAIVFHFPHYAKGRNQTPQSAILARNLKLIRFYETDEIRLFDLAKDIGEKCDLTAQMSHKAEQMATELDAYLARIEAQIPMRNPHFDPTNADSHQESGQERRFRRLVRF